MSQESPKFSSLGFARSIELVSAAVSTYFSLLGSAILPLLSIALLLHIPDIIMVFGNSFFQAFPDGPRILLKVLMGLLGATLAVCFPYFCLRVFITLKGSGNLSTSGLLSGFNLGEFWRILVIVSMTHVLGLLPLFIPAIMLWLQYFHEIFLWISLSLFILYIPVWILILWFLSYTLHHYYILREVSWTPLRASYRLVRQIGRAHV